MKMQMVHDLARRPAVIERHPITPFQPSRMRRLAHRQQQLARQVLIRQLIKHRYMLFRYHQNMHRRLGVNIIECHRNIVLPYQLLGAAIGYRTKNTIIHTDKYSACLKRMRQYPFVPGLDTKEKHNSSLLNPLLLAICLKQAQNMPGHRLVDIYA